MVSFTSLQLQPPPPPPQKKPSSFVRIEAGWATELIWTLWIWYKSLTSSRRPVRRADYLTTFMCRLSIAIAPNTLPRVHRYLSMPSTWLMFLRACYMWIFLTRRWQCVTKDVVTEFSVLSPVHGRTGEHRERLVMVIVSRLTCGPGTFRIQVDIRILRLLVVSGSFGNLWDC
jgi:hypothetical protein